MEEKGIGQWSRINGSDSALSVLNWNSREHNTRDFVLFSYRIELEVKSVNNNRLSGNSYAAGKHHKRAKHTQRAGPHPTPERQDPWISMDVLEWISRVCGDGNGDFYIPNRSKGVYKQKKGKDVRPQLGSRTVATKIEMHTHTHASFHPATWQLSTICDSLRSLVTLDSKTAFAMWTPSPIVAWGDTHCVATLDKLGTENLKNQ